MTDLDKALGRIADSLERMEKMLEKLARPPVPYPVPPPSQPWRFDLDLCGICGERHAMSGLPCPKLTGTGNLP